MVDDTAVHQIRYGVLRQRSVGGKPQVGEEEDGVTIGGGDRVNLRLHQKRSGKPAIDLLRAQSVWMRMIPVRSRASIRQDELVGPTVSARDRIHRIAVLIGRQRHGVAVVRTW